jgi:hypothetical protein
LNCFRYLDFKSFDEVDRLTWPEYELLMEAARLREIDKDYRSHLVAWLTFAAKAMKSKGKKKQVPVYDRFEKFYDYKKALEKPDENKKSRFSGIGKFLNKGVKEDGD